MYYPIEIGKLSKVQKVNLLKGKNVRIKKGTSETIYLTEQQINKLERNHRLGKRYTVKLTQDQIAKTGSGLFGDVYSYVKRTPVLKNVVNAAIRGGKKYAHQGVNYISSKAHRKIEDFPTIGDGLALRRKPKAIGARNRYIKGNGIIGDIAGFINPTAGVIAKTLGLGMKKKYGKGLLTDIAKEGVKAIAKKGIEVGSNYLTDKIEGMGLIRQATPKQLEHLAKIRAIRQANLLASGKIPKRKSYGPKKQATPTQLANLALGRERRAANLLKKRGGALYPA